MLFLNSTDPEHRFDEGQWKWFHPRDAARHARLPDATRHNYADCTQDGTRPLLFAHAPHVLFRGSLDVTRLAVVEL